jgi:hypothetical protein
MYVISKMHKTKRWTLFGYRESNPALAGSEMKAADASRYTISDLSKVVITLINILILTTTHST